MARVGEWGRGEGGGGRCCSYKRTTIVVCFLNLVAAFYLFRTLYTSYYIFSSSSAISPPSSSASKYTDHQIERMKVREASEPTELIKLAKKLKKEFSRKKRGSKLSEPMKQKLANEILLRFKELDDNTTLDKYQEALEKWRVDKIQEIKTVALGNAAKNSTLSIKESKTLRRALESGWFLLLEDAGVWIPVQVVNKKLNETELDLDEEDIIAGPPLPRECNAEVHTDYDGAAVRWGLTHRKETAAECCQACLDQAKYAKPGEMMCNIWVYCPSEGGCFSPDKYEHRHQECWLKQADKPKLNFKDKYSEVYRNSHPLAPIVVPWMSGVVSP